MSENNENLVGTEVVDNNSSTNDNIILGAGLVALAAAAGTAAGHLAIKGLKWVGKKFTGKVEEAKKAVAKKKAEKKEKPIEVEAEVIDD